MERRSLEGRIAANLADGAWLEDAVQALAGPLEAALSEAMASAAAHFRAARVLRSAAHLRPDGGYAGLVATAADPAQQLRASATAWRWVQALECPVEVQIATGAIIALEEPRRVVAEGGAAALGSQTRMDFDARGVTHLLALPIPLATRAIGGMWCFEVACPMAMHQRFQPFYRAAPALEGALVRFGPQLFGLPRRPAAAPISATGHVGRAMEPVLADLQAFVFADETVLITGPSGSGKSFLARMFHDNSPRRDGPFETVMLPAIPENLVEGELFGWVPGAHHQAHTTRVGQITRAEGGTVFLDEIDKLSLEVQRKLLYLLDSRRYRVLGDSGPERAADVRFVVATNADLGSLLAEGRFLEDLFWRINALRVDVPPLCRRSDELPGWARHMLETMHRKVDPTAQVHLDPEALALLVEHSWPGNLRELRSVLQRAWLTSLSGRPTREGDLTIGADALRRALHPQQAQGSGGVVASLRAAARAFVDAMESNERSLSLADIGWSRDNLFRSFVIVEAADRLGDRECMLRLGKADWVDQRVHGRKVREAREAVRAFRDG